MNLTAAFPSGSTVTRLLLLSAVTLLGFSAGCASNNHPGGSAVSPAYDFAPKELAQDVRQIVAAPPISLPVQDEQDGMIVTGWQPFQGDWHILHHWYERTRYHITVLPDFNNPAHRSRIQIVDETQQRPAESGPNEQAKKWSASPDLHRPERSAALLQQIESQLVQFR